MASPPALGHQTDRELGAGYIQVDCAGGKCYGVLAAHRVCFSLALFHLILNTFLIGVENTQAKRAAIQNGYRPIRSTSTPS